MPYPREERDELERVSGQRRVPVLVNADDVVVESRWVVRHVYRRYGGPGLRALRVPSSTATSSPTASAARGHGMTRVWRDLRYPAALRQDVTRTGSSSEGAGMTAQRDRRFGGIGLGGLIVIIGVVLMFVLELSASA